VGDDQQEFTDLYLGSRARLAAQVYALTGNAGEAAESVQEAFVRAWVNWEAIRQHDDREAWVRKVAFRLAVSRWRKLRHVIVFTNASEMTQVEPGGERVDMVQALLRLPLAQRRALVLHHMAGLSVEETAAEMGVLGGTVKSWLWRGRRQLAEALGRPADAEPLKEML
jgi:RNA polymerase sigma-70 factor, ECF subfamily